MRSDLRLGVTKQAGLLVRKMKLVADREHDGLATAANRCLDPACPEGWIHPEEQSKGNQFVIALVPK